MQKNQSRGFVELEAILITQEIMDFNAGGFHKWGYPKMDGLQWKIYL